eukprot:37345_1
MKCPQINISKTATFIFSEKNQYRGWDNYCLTKTFIESGPLDIICDIQIIEVDNRLMFEVTHSENTDMNRINDDMKEEINNKDNKITKYEQTIMTLQKQIVEITTVKEKKILMLQKHNETLRNNKDKTQTQIKQLENGIKNIQIELDETRQANLRQQKTILELQNLNKEEEKMDNKQQYLSKVLIDLGSEIELFKQNYNTKTLNEIFDKTPTKL